LKLGERGLQRLQRASTLTAQVTRQMESIVTTAKFVGLCLKYFPFFFGWAFQLSPFDPSRHFGKMQNSVDIGT
jgi:hypothetical protein